MTTTAVAGHPKQRTDRAEHHAEPDDRRTSWAVLAIALTAQILVVLDISVVNTALPTIGKSLHLRGGDLHRPTGQHSDGDCHRHRLDLRRHASTALSADAATSNGSTAGATGRRSVRRPGSATTYQMR